MIVEEWGAFPGPHMTVERMWALRNRIAEHVARPEIAGVVVTKAHTHLLDAFESPGLGPVGVLDDGEVIFRRSLPPAPPALSPRSLATPVDIVLAWAGADDRLLDAARVLAKGVVVAGMGRGNVPPAMVPGIERWIADDKPVVIASRAQRGCVGRTYGYPGGGRNLHQLGAIFAGSRRPQQARIDLMLGLGMGLSVAKLRELFEGREQGAGSSARGAASREQGAGGTSC